MEKIFVDFSEVTGAIKPMHSVNNGPVYKFAPDQRITNVYSYREAGIPYARTHDASFCSTYGGEHIVDVNFIFTDFDADPYDPESYDFTLTDEYMRMIEAGGAKVFYRLGSKIEHWSKKYNTLPPKDFKKWAVVCEHIIRHYCYGWAQGFNMDIEYWEIWNEPDLDADDSPNKRCWGGTAKQFYQLFKITLEHLKSCFPELKIGGPACAGFHEEWVKGLFESLGDVKPDFFSWHIYANTVEKVRARLRKVREYLDGSGYTHIESILNEWNYVKGWEGDEWIYSLKTEKSLKGAAFIAATMLMCQKEPLDNLMFYDARPCGMNSLYNTDYVSECLKGYYPFYMFNQLYKLKNEVQSISSCDDIWVCAAKGEEHAAMITYYNDDDSSKEKQVELTFKNVDVKNGVRVEYYALDAENDAKLVKQEVFTASEFTSYIKLPVYTTYLVKAVSL